MQEQMRLLIELQEIDAEMKGTREQRLQFESKLNVLREDRERVQTMVDSLATQLEELEGQRSQLNLSLTQERENLEKAEGRLPSIQTQKEYVAVLKEVDTAKKLSKELEEQVAAKAEEIGSLSSDKEEKDGELASLVTQEKAQEEEISEDLEKLAGDLQSKEGARGELYEKVSASLRRRYDQLIKRREGIAVVVAIEGACTGCNMHLPPQLYNSLFRVDEVRTCPHCNRVIYVEAAR